MDSDIDSNPVADSSTGHRYDEDNVILSISTRRDGPRAIVDIEGELDLAGVETLKEQVRSVVDQEATSVLEVDAGQVAFVDSCGLAALVTIRSDALSAGIAFRMTAASDHFLRVVKLAGLEEWLVPTSD